MNAKAHGWQSVGFFIFCKPCAPCGVYHTNDTVMGRLMSHPKISRALEAMETRRLFTVDLICAFVSIDSYDSSTGALNYSVGVANTGNADTPVFAPGAVFLSSDLVVNNKDDIRLAAIDPTDTPHFSSKIIHGTLQVPTSLKGEWHLGAALDIDSKVIELHGNEDNNYSFSTNTITVPEQFDVNLSGTDGDDKIDISGGITDDVLIKINDQRFTYPKDRVASITINGLAGKDRIVAATDFNRALYIIGGDGNDIIVGGAASDTLTGAAGKDTIRGGGGKDRLNGSGGAEQLFGDGDADRLFGNAGDDMLDGGSSADRLDGGDGHDTVYGQSGNDIITANDKTQDLLFGGSGDDTATVDAIDVTSSIIT
jgi:Ca2+-binding RTX toxin-like protein